MESTTTSAIKAEPSIVVPGTLLGSAREYRPGNGTYFRRGGIFASAVGVVCIAPPRESQLPILSVVPPSHLTGSNLDDDSKIVQELAKGTQSGVRGTATTLPTPGDTVLAKVTHITSRNANVDIIAVGGCRCAHPFRGVIRSTDVRSMDRDSVRIVDCFRPGDIVRASVISLGDARSFYLSTADASLGVVFATDVYGSPLIPVAWDKMVEPKSGAIELRKCARPQSVGDTK